MTPAEMKRQLELEAADIEAQNLQELLYLKPQIHYLQTRVDEAYAKAEKAMHDFEQHKKDLERCGTEMQKQLDHIKSGFPNNDPLGHVAFHNRQIEKAKDEADLMRSTKQKFIVGGTWSALIFIGLAVWEYIKAQVHK